MASRRILEDFRLLKTNGDVCTDGVATIYLAGTTTPASGYSDKDLSQSGASVKNFDSAGYPPNIFISTAISVKVVITGDAGNILITKDYYAQATDVSSNVFDALSDPGADRIAFWDESANAAAWLQLDSGLSISGTTFSLDPELAALVGLTSAADKIAYYTGSGAAALTDFKAPARSFVADATPLQGMLYGLTLSNNVSDATNDIDVAAGVAADATGARLMRLAASITKRIDASWAVGTGQGGMDTGSVSNAWYHIWLIMRSDTGVVDVLFSLSATSPTMPTNYDYKRRLGAIVRNGGVNEPFVQYGDVFLWKTLTGHKTSVGGGVGSLGTSAITVALSSPSSIQVDALVAFLVEDATPAAATYGLVTALDQTDAAPSSANGYNIFLPAAGAGVPTSSIAEYRVRTDTSSQIRLRLSASNADITASAWTKGWIDTRDRFG